MAICVHRSRTWVPSQIPPASTNVALHPPVGLHRGYNSRECQETCSLVQCTACLSFRHAIGSHLIEGDERPLATRYDADLHPRPSARRPRCPEPGRFRCQKGRGLSCRIGCVSCSVSARVWCGHLRPTDCFSAAVWAAEVTRPLLLCCNRCRLLGRRLAVYMIVGRREVR